MFIDTDIRPSIYPWLIRGFFVLFVLLLTVLAEMALWQMTLLMVLALMCALFDWYRRTPIFALATKDPSDVWELGVYHAGDEELWQGYLNDICVLDIGGLTLLKLTFFITVPEEKPHTVLIFRSSIDEGQFRQLSTLAQYGGYQ